MGGDFGGFNILAAGCVYIGALVGPREVLFGFGSRGLYNIYEKLKPLSTNCMIHFRLLAINFALPGFD